MNKLEIEIIFSKSKTIGSFALRKYMNTKFSHVLLKLNYASLDREVIYEASNVGVRCMKLQNWETHNQIIDRFPITLSPDRKKELIKYCIDHLGIKYGFLSIPAILFHDLIQKNIGLGDDGERRMICSEFLYLAVKDIIGEINEDSDFIKPSEIYSKLKEKYHASNI